MNHQRPTKALKDWGLLGSRKEGRLQNYKNCYYQDVQSITAILRSTALLSDLNKIKADHQVSPVNFGLKGHDRQYNISCPSSTAHPIMVSYDGCPGKHGWLAPSIKSSPTEVRQTVKGHQLQRKKTGFGYFRGNSSRNSSNERMQLTVSE